MNQLSLGREAMQIIESEKQYREALRENIEAHEKRIHIALGPIPKCGCEICKKYRRTSKIGPEHKELEHMCHCTVCGSIKRYRRKVAARRHYMLKKKRLKR